MVALNAALICLAALFAATLVGLELAETGRVALVVGSAAAISLIVNLVVLRRRFEPLENLIEEMEKVDLSRPGANLPPSIDGKAETEEVERIELAFLRMMRRLEAERRRAGTAALRAQEEERARVARDLHDEVNQSLTGVLLRLEAARDGGAAGARAEELAETKALANQAMNELLSLARQLRPTALDDLGLKAAIGGLVEQLGGRARSPPPSRPTATSPSCPTTSSWSSTGSPRRRSPTRPATAAPSTSGSACAGSATGSSWRSPTTAAASPSPRPRPGSAWPGCASGRCWSAAS